MECAQECKEKNKQCENDICRYWIKYEQDLNCSLIAAGKEGPMTLQEIGKRLGLSISRVSQIETKAKTKLFKSINEEEQGVY